MFKEKFSYILLVIILLLSWNSLCDAKKWDQPQNIQPYSWMLTNNFILRLTGPSWHKVESNNKSYQNTFMVFLQSKLTQVLQDPLFQNYLNVLVRRYFNCNKGFGTSFCNPDSPPFFDPNDFSIALPEKITGRYVYVNKLINWLPKPFVNTKLNLPEIGTVYLRAWFENWSQRGGTFGGIKVPDNQANPGAPILTIEDPDKVKVYLWAGQAFNDNGTNKEDGLVAELDIPGVSMEIVMGTPISGEWGEYDITDREERLNHVDRYIRATARISFDLAFRIYFKVVSYEDWSENKLSSFDLGKLGVYISKITFSLNNFRLSDFNPGPFASFQYANSYWYQHQHPSLGVSPFFIYRSYTNPPSIMSPGFTPLEVQGIFVRCGYCRQDGSFYPMFVTTVQHKFSIAGVSGGVWDNSNLNNISFCDMYYADKDWNVVNISGNVNCPSADEGKFVEVRRRIDMRYFTSVRVTEFLPYIEGEIKLELSRLIDSALNKFEGSYVLLNLSNPNNFIDNILKFNAINRRGEKIPVKGIFSLSTSGKVDYIGQLSNTIMSGVQDSSLLGGGTIASGLMWFTGIGFSLRRNWTTILQLDPILNNIMGSFKVYGLVDGWGYIKNGTYLNSSADQPSWLYSNKTFTKLEVLSNNKINYFSEILRPNKIFKTFGPAYLSSNYRSSKPYPYMLGVAIHQNILNTIFSVLNDYGVTVFELNRNREMPDNSLFNTEQWKTLFPRFYERYHYVKDGKERGYPMMIRIVPGYAPDSTGSTSMDSTVPHIVVGGINPYDKIETTHYSVFPDLTIDFPNLYTEFYVWYKDSWRKVFSIVSDTRILFSIELNKKLTYNGSNYTISTTNYPIGCGGNSSIPCEVVGADTKRVLYVGVAIKGHIKSVFPAPDMPSSVTTTNVSLSEQEYHNAIANIIGMILNSDLNLNGEAVFDMGAMLNMPIGITSVTIGPDWLYWHDSPNNVCYDPNGVASDGSPKDVNGDSDDNCYGDYFIAAFSITEFMGDNLPKYVLRLVDNIINKRPFNHIYDYDYTPGFNHFSSSPIADVGEPIILNDQPTIDYFAPYIKNFEIDSRKKKVFIEVTGGYAYSYKLDNGVWTPFIKSNVYTFDPVFAGKHTIYIRVEDSKGRIAPEVVSRTFDYDPYPPIITSFKVDKLANKALVSFKVIDDSPVTTVYYVDGKFGGEFYNGESISIKGFGKHTLTIKAIDKFGNVTTQSHQIILVPESAGCNSGGNSDVILMALFLIAFAYVLKNKRMRNAE